MNVGLGLFYYNILVWTEGFITRQDQQIVEKARTLMYPNKGKKRLALEVTDTTDNTDGTNGTDGGEEKRMKTGQPTFKEPLNPPSEDK